MRIKVITAIAAFVLTLPVAVAAQSSGATVQGFGGATFGTTTNAATFGGTVAIPLTDHLQVIGEAGRLTDVKADLLDDVLDLTPVDVGLAAWYAEGGVRFSASRHSVVRPYVEATAGVARLRPSVGVDGWLGGLTNTGLNYLGTTDPIAGVGGGVVFQGGPLAVDLGYRYKRIFASDALSSVFALGDDGLNVNQVRIGFGVRF